MKFLYKMMAAVALIGAPATAQAGPILNVVNGHHYELVGGAFSWTEALAAANSSSYNGVTGHLVTITSAAENVFVQNLFSGFAWIAASDSGSEGNFTWRAGPETGGALTYSNWAPGEPNNSGFASPGVEDYALIRSQDGAWVDVKDNYGLSYIVEYGAIAAVPEPATWAMMLLGFGAIGFVMRRTRKSDERFTRKMRELAAA